MTPHSMSDTPMQTRRLVLRPFTMEDVDAAFGWFGDADVMRFTPTGPDASPAATRARVAEYMRHQAMRGFSKWIVCERNSGEPIGDAGLMTLDDTGEIELGFRLARSQWGNGYATEAAKAWIDRASQDLPTTRLFAFAHPQNAASLRVLAKLGFVPQGQRVIMGMESEAFRLAAMPAIER